MALGSGGRRWRRLWLGRGLWRRLCCAAGVDAAGVGAGVDAGVDAAGGGGASVDGRWLVTGQYRRH